MVGGLVGDHSRKGLCSKSKPHQAVSWFWLRLLGAQFVCKGELLHGKTSLTQERELLSKEKHV
jgi:hypothetical protein